MESTVFPALSFLIWFHFSLTCYAEDAETLPCPEYQEGFDGSCFEFVALQRSFLSAEGWCERGGGHLAFILNDETQQFLQKHLEREKDWWLGLAPAAPNLTLDNVEGSLAWLDGSDVSYSNWVNTPDAQAACGYVLGHSGFQWEATANCSQELNFICQFDSGTSIACGGQNATLQCGSGQVIEIEDSFYGRKTIHYCRSKLPASPTSSQEECSWIDVIDSVTAHCHGLQACQTPMDPSSFGEPCPALGSYLSVEYRCKHGLQLLMSTLVAVFDNVTITVKWLLHPFKGNLTCTLNAGDGHTIDPYNPDELESTVMHKFSRPGVYVVGVECTTSDWHVTAQKAVTVQEPVGEFSVIECYGRNGSTGGTKCSVLYGTFVQIQVMVEAGTNVSYTIQHNDHVVANSSVDIGIKPHNITLGNSAVEKLGHGCHNLTLTASNVVTEHTVSTYLELCLLDFVEGLQASLVSEEDECPDTTDLIIAISLERGAPVQLLFNITGVTDALSETRDMFNGSLQAYTFSSPLEGLVKVSVRATNAFSASDVDVDLKNIFEVCQNYSDFSTDKHGNKTGNISVNNSADFKIIATPDILTEYSQTVSLTVSGTESLPRKGLTFEWKCKGNCKCRNKTKDEILVIGKDCLPNPFEFFKYTLTVRKMTWFRKSVDLASASKCITVSPKEFTNITISCDNCGSINVNNSVKLRLSCVTSCPDVVWYIEDPKPLLGDLETCYSKVGRRLPIEKQDGGTEYVVLSQHLNISRRMLHNISVIAYGKKESGFAKYTLPIPDPEPTLSPEVPAEIHPISCSISPPSGTVLDAFDITCKPSSFCAAGCYYCFKTDTGKYLRCSNANEVKSVFLPLGDQNNNYRLSVVVTVKNENVKVTTTITTQVRKSNSSTSVVNLQSAVDKTMSQLKEQGLLSGEALGQIFTSVSDMLNAEAGQDQKDEKRKLREQMLTEMTTVLLESPTNTTEEVQVTARAVAGLTQRSDELSLAAQEEAGSLLVDLSSSLNTISVNHDSENDGEVVQAATPIVEAASNILNVSSNKKVSDFLLTGINNVQSALLNNKQLNGEPAIIDTDQISVYVNRVNSETMQMQEISVQKNSSSRFLFPRLPKDIISPDEPVDVRMMSFERNPYSWREENITGTVGSISLTRVNGTVIPVENLPNEIEILLPRLDVGQENSTVLDLANFSTLIIDVPSPVVTLVLKMEPSEDISFMLFLGSKDYPSEEKNVAKAQLPLENSKEEEKYTWVLSPKDRREDVGVHYLVIKPIVEPGIKSINATVTVTSIAAQCKYWNETASSWSENGCRVGPLTTPLVTQCLCNHLTFFGSSFFVMPNLVDVSRTAELFATFTNNPVVVCFVGAIFAAYLLVVGWARRKDIQDSAKVKITILEDNHPLAEYRYVLSVYTGHRHGASTSSQVTITLIGTEGESEPHHLTDPEKPVFERGGADMFLLTTQFSLGDLQSIRLWHDNSGEHTAWYVNKVMVQDMESGQKWHFLCNSWLAVDVGECTLDKVFPVATETDLKRFSNLFFMKTAKDFHDGHIWFSVISRPPSSTFTRVQRVSCCLSLLLCTMLTSIMFWGIPTDPSEQTMDLGHIEFTWQQVMIGIQSSIIMFPINLLIVSIFRNTRPREKTNKTDATKQGKTVRVAPSQTSSPQKELKDITPDTVIKDIKRIAQSLLKAMKSPLPHLELPGQHVDINTLLSLVEDIIRQQNRVAGDFYTDASKRDRSMILSLGAVNLQDDSVWGSPEKCTDEYKKRNNNSRYLYRQLHHVEKELGLLGPSRFSNPDSFNLAMQQVQGMRAFLEYCLPLCSLDRDHYNSSPSPEENTNGDNNKKCCQGGLPWWFVFVGWILVIATSGVAGYFTMMYGLTYGKDRSISWLISMVVSFFESLFITQPLKVLGFAAFFALVLKKVDQEEYGEPQIDDNLRNPDNPNAVWGGRRDSTCSFYQPPPPADIERMRNNMIKEQKVFGLIREILAYMGFMWMLLLVAYGQRDPNAYFLTRHIQQSFSKGISDSMRIQDVFTWANTTLLNNLFGEHPGFITDGNSKLVGSARLRQVRVKKNSCHIAHSMQQSVPDCHAPYSWEVEDMGLYSPGWNLSVEGNTSLNLHSPWTYQSQGMLRTHPIWGSVKLYRGGGFVMDLGPDLQTSRRSLQYLYDNTWFDAYTQAIFVEFTVYNANVNLFCIVTLMLETTAIGAFQFRSELQSVRLYQSTGGLIIFVMASEVIYFLFIIYYMFVQGKLMKQQKLTYFKSKWNLLELAIIILSWSALSVFIKRTLLGKRDVDFYQNNKDQYASFHETATADSVLGYLIAFLVLLATVKLWHLLRLNPKLHMITATLQRAWTDISGFLVVMTIMFLAYSISSNLMYGWKLYSYRTLLDATQTMVSLQLGIFNYEEVLNYNPVLGAFLIGSCIVFMTFVVLNLFISVILVAFSQEQIHHKPSEEEEIVDLMLVKLCSLFGVKCKKRESNGPTDRPFVSSASNNELSTMSSEG